MALAKHGSAEETCDVAGFDKPAERSFNNKKVANTTLSQKSIDHRPVHLCKDHYKEFKKQTKTDRELDSYY